jgi:orotidine-5'-phosphate decarboxylase
MHPGTSPAADLGPQILVALDYESEANALELAGALDPKLCRLKVGKELFTRAGPRVVERLQNKGFDIFLDLKFHDIPNTCAKAVKAAADLGVWMVNVHATGGYKMMAAAAEVLTGYPLQSRPKLIAVTVLTSMGSEDLADTGVVKPLTQQVADLAQMAKDAGLLGVVCSAQEAGLIKSLVANDFLTVTPGIRPAGTNADDQARITTPTQAITGGSDYLVIGRPITQADNPGLACRAIAAEIAAL